MEYVMEQLVQSLASKKKKKKKPALLKDEGWSLVSLVLFIRMNEFGGP